MRGCLFISNLFFYDIYNILGARYLDLILYFRCLNLFCMKYIFSLVLLFSIITSCGSSNNNSKVDSVSNRYIKISEEKFSGDIKYIFNDDNTRVICKGRKSNLEQTFSFFIYSNKSHSETIETFNNVSDVRWVDNKTIKYIYLSGIVNAKGEGQEYIIINLEE